MASSDELLNQVKPVETDGRTCQWKDAGKELPEDGKKVFVLTENGNGALNSVYTFGGKRQWHSNYKVAYWMPVPPAPGTERDKMKKDKKEKRTFLNIEFKYDSDGHIHFVNPSCDDIKFTDFVRLIGALTEIEEGNKTK